MKTLWQKMMWVLYSIWALGFLVLGIQFTRHNAMLVNVDLLFWASPALSLGLVLSITLFAGMLIGLLMMWPLVIRRRYHSAQLIKKQNSFRL